MQPIGLRVTGFIESWIFCCLTSRRSQRLLALAVPLSRFTPLVGGGSAFYVRQQSVARVFPVEFRGGVFGGSVFGSEVAGGPVPVDSSPESFGLS